MYSPQQLPVESTVATHVTVGHARDGWAFTLSVIDGMRQYTLGPSLKQRMENMRFYVLMAMAQIDEYLSAGYSTFEPVSDVPGLQEVVRLYQHELTGLQMAWPKTSTPAQATMAGYGGFGGGPEMPSDGILNISTDDEPGQWARSLQDLNKPKEMIDYWAAASVAAALLLLSFALRN